MTEPTNKDRATNPANRPPVSDDQGEALWQDIKREDYGDDADLLDDDIGMKQHSELR